jgi:hypothetical protein
MAALFDDVERHDVSPASPVEDSFTFLNRARGNVWARQRELLDTWYTAFPDLDGDLRRRFRKRSPQQHYAAWWELYVHAVLRALGFEVTVHPVIPGTSGHPDFLAEREEESFYVEAATVFSGIIAPTRGAKLRPSIEEVIGRIDASTFFVILTFDRLGESMPSTRSIRGPIEAWLATLDPEQVRVHEAAGQEAWKRFAFGDWIIALQPHAWSPELRGRSNNPFIGSRQGLAGPTNDIPQLRNAITRKGKRYGTPGKPLLVAVLATNGFVGDREITHALFGSEAILPQVATGTSKLVRSPDGFWIGKRGAAGRQISAVLMGVGILPHTAAKAWPTVWHHFDPRHQLDVDLPFSTVRAVGNKLKFEDAKHSASQVLGLPSDWPGLEPAFPRYEHRPEDHQIATVARL